MPAWQHTLSLREVAPVQVPKLFHVATAHLVSPGSSPPECSVSIHVHSRLWQKCFGPAPASVLLEIDRLPQTGDAPVGDAPPGAYRCRGKVYASRETDTDHVLGISCGGMLCLLTTAKDSPAALDAKARALGGGLVLTFLAGRAKQ